MVQVLLLAAAVTAACNKAISPIDVITSGGDKLQVSFEQKNKGLFENVYLKGPTRKIYTGEFTAEALL